MFTCSMLPQSVMSAVFTYFLSGHTSRYAPMDTICFSPSVSPSSTATPSWRSLLPLTYHRCSFASSPPPASVTLTSRRGSRVDRAG